MTSPLRTSRLELTPLRKSDAADMVAVLADPVLYAFTGGEPPTLAGLEAQYGSQVAGSGTPDEVWLNWIVRLGGAAIGFVQATVYATTAEVAWVIGVPWQGNGYAGEAAAAMCDWLGESGVTRLSARIHPDHAASNAVAAKVGLHRTGDVDADGEVLWVSGVDLSSR